MADIQREQDHVTAARNARALLDPDGPPRSFFVGVSYESGSDFAHGVNKAAVESGDAVIDTMETLAVHINVIAEVTNSDPTEVASAALSIAEDQDPRDAE